MGLRLRYSNESRHCLRLRLRAPWRKRSTTRTLSSKGRRLFSGRRSGCWILSEPTRLISDWATTRSADDPYLPYTLYERKLRVDVAEVLWPPSLNGITNILFGCYIVKKWPPSWWAYTNTPGIFFLRKEYTLDNEEWTRLDRFDDWIQPTTNATSVQAAVTRIKVRGEHLIRQPNGSVDRSQPFGSKTNRMSGTAGSGR